MISHLGITGLGVIHAADVDLAPGLVVFTGETGAGKTMLVSALGLVLGDRFDSTLLGPAGTRVQATVDVPADSIALDRVREAGGEVSPATPSAAPADSDHPGDPGELHGGGTELIIGRFIPPSGRGRAVAGGATVPLSVLAEVGESIAQRHSQSDQIGLRSARVQRQALDRFGGPELAAALADYRDVYRSYLDLTGRLAEAVRVDRDRADVLATLTADLAAIRAAEPQESDAQLDSTISRLTHAETLHEHLATAQDALSDDEAGASTRLGAAAAQLGRAAQHDPTLRPLETRLLELQEQAAEVGREVSERAAGSHADPAELARLQARKAVLAPLLRRFGPTPGDLVARQAELERQLAEAGGGEDTITALRRDVATCLTALADSAARLTGVRRRAAELLAARVTAELAGLAMPQARLSVTVEHRDEPGGLTLSDGSTVAFGESGTDVVRFLLAPHAGATPAPIGDGASGGELSRIMLALEVVLSESSPPSVFIFDEVDAGIGGRTAVEVGRRLARLARSSQVLVVTHLAQVASFADQHIVVRKNSDGVVTATTISEVTGSERTSELSRMLSGQDESAAAQAHAAELLDLAARERDTPVAESAGSSR